MIKPLLFILGAVAAVAVIYRAAVAYRLPDAEVSSWFRTPLHNLEVGGVSRSLHLIGWAVDLVPPTPDVEAGAREIFGKVINEGDHIHAQVI